VPGSLGGWQKARKQTQAYIGLNFQWQMINIINNQFSILQEHPSSIEN
jgi:hypothetical protein